MSSVGTEPAVPAGAERRGRRSARLGGSSIAGWVERNRFLAGAILTGLAARIAFVLITDRRLDDALITIKFDKNLAAGVGFVHNLGSGHVQGFTSALSVLVPLPGELIAPGGGFLLIRLVSLAAFVVAMVYADRICGTLGLSKWPARFVLAYLALDPLQVYFGMVGMETQMAIAVLLAGIYYVLTEHYPRAGIALGLAILARPDFVLWVGPALVYLFIRSRRGALRSAAIAAAIVLPWVVFTTIYFGSPIPNTIAAKSAAFAPAIPSILNPHALLHFLRVTIDAHANEWQAIAPFYEKALVLKAPVANWLLEGFVLIIVALALIGAVRLGRIRGFLPALAYVLIFEAYKIVYLSYGYYDWYGPPAFAVFMFFAAGGLDALYAGIGRLWPRQRRPRFSPAWVIPTVMAAAFAAPLPFLTISEAKIQHHVEAKVRVPLGQYLGREVKVGQTYTSESSGYVGWDNNGTLYDFPGLEAPRVAKLEREQGLSWAHNHSPVGLASPQAIAYFLRPDWLVLRPVEFDDFRTRFPQVYADYRVARIFGRFNSPRAIDVGGMQYWNTDSAFVVLRKVR